MLGAVLGYSLSRRSVGQSLSQYFIFDGSSMFLAIAHVGNSFCCDPHLEPPTLNIVPAGAIYALSTEIGIDGNAIFANNSAVVGGGKRGRGIFIVPRTCLEESEALVYIYIEKKRSAASWCLPSFGHLFAKRVPNGIMSTWPIHLKVDRSRL